MLLNNIAMVDLHRAFSDAEAVLRCKICLERLHKPVFLKICQHTFCEECISKVYLSAGKNFCPYCKNSEPENKIISADYGRDKLEVICNVLLRGIKQDFGQQVSQRITNSSNIGFSNYNLREVKKNEYSELQGVGLVEKLDTNKENATFRVDSSSLADSNSTFENPALYLDETNVEMQNYGNNEMTNVEHEHESINCEPPEKRRCELSNEGNISADHIMQNGTGEINADIKTEEVWW